jgi:hypothetical protein
MILVPNRLLPSNGNKAYWFIILLVGLSSCGILSPASKNDPSGNTTEQPGENLPPISGTRVYDPVKQQWVTVQAAPREKMDTLVFSDISTSRIPPLTMDGVDQYRPSTSTGQQLDKYRMALLLPFLSNRINPDAEAIDNSVSNWSLQFYAGAKMALQDLEKENKVSLEVSVMDTEGDPQRVQRLLGSRVELANANVIIGPYRRENIRLVADFAKQKNALLISPYSAATNLTAENSNFVQISPSLETHCENLLQHARNEFEPEEIVLVARDIPIEKQCLATLQKEHFNILETSFADSLTTLIAPQDATEFLEMDISAYFEMEDKLAFIVPSWADESFVYSLLRKIDLERDEETQQVVVYGFPQWMSFEHIDFEYYEKLNVRVSSNSFVDKEDERVKSFQRNFYDVYGQIPENEAYLGYDLIFYLGEMLSQYGTGFMEVPKEQQMINLMHTRFNLQPVLQNSINAVELNLIDRYENKYVNILEFSNFAFERSNQ